MKIAIIGMAFRFPKGVDTPERLWQVLENGEDLIEPIPKKRLALMPDKDFPRLGGWLDDVQRFDASFFGLNGLEAAYCDPQQRMLLETSWLALENAALDPGRIKGREIGVYMGAHTNDYQELIAHQKAEINAYWNPGLNSAVLANRISYFYDFTGPSLTVNTACSSSLEALVLACNDLKSRRTEAALVGGVNLMLTGSVTQSAQRAGMLSPEGRCKTFDLNADGFVRSEGVAVLVLKPLDHALRDGDPIHGMVLAAESGHGGRARSFVSPNPVRQADLITRAWRAAGEPITSADMLETHGTGTVLGDSLETSALMKVFDALLPEDWEGRPFCGMGSIKTNLGHGESVAGLAGVIKVLLAMQHKRRPKLVHFEVLSDYINLEGTPMFPLTETVDWPAETPRRAGVSSFGFGGSYAHVVLQEVRQNPARPKRQEELILLSARNTKQLKATAAKLAESLNPRTPLGHIAQTLMQGRQAMPARLTLMAENTEALIQQLRAFVNGEDSDVQTSYQKESKRRRVINPPGVAVHPFGDLAGLANRWLGGENLDWAYLRRGKRIHLPGYVFENKKHWIPK